MVISSKLKSESDCVRPKSRRQLLTPTIILYELTLTSLFDVSEDNVEGELTDCRGKFRLEADFWRHNVSLGAREQPDRARAYVGGVTLNLH